MAVYKAINKLATEVYQNNKEKGFWEDYFTLTNLSDNYVKDSAQAKAVHSLFIAQRIALIHSELSEALEADRKDLMDDKLTHRKGLEVELADALIRILDMAGGLELDIGGAVEEKLAYNKSRPYRHGKAY